MESVFKNGYLENNKVKPRSNQPINYLKNNGHQVYYEILKYIQIKTNQIILILHFVKIITATFYTLSFL